MGVEARGVGHRDLGPHQGALEGTREVAVAGEAQPAPLGVAHTEALDRGRLLLGLFTHDRPAYRRFALVRSGEDPGVTQTLPRAAERTAGGVLVVSAIQQFKNKQKKKIQKIAQHIHNTTNKK